MKTRQAQDGVVLIMSLVMLVIVSLLAVTTMKGALSSENISGSVRLNQLANQSAEVALRFCEDAALAIARGESPGPTAQAVTIPPAVPLWQKMATTWDVENAAVFVIPLTQVNNAGAPYKRPPECLIEHLAATGTPLHNKLFVVTARGFGPEVASATALTDKRPTGSEVFLQSTVELEEVVSP